MSRELLFIALAIISLPMLLFADFHYASHEGSNEYPYTSWETAADSIQLAIDAAEAGDTIYVGAGIWEQHDINLWDSLALIGMGIDTTIIRNSTSDEYIWMNDYTTVSRFTFDSPEDQTNGEGIEILFKEEITIKNNKFYRLNYGVFGIFTGEIINNTFEENRIALHASFAPCSAYVKGNTFSTNEEVTIYARNGHWTFINNLIHYNPDTDIGSVVSLYMPGSNDTAYAANNLFYRNLDESSTDRERPLTIGPKGFAENNTIIGFEDAQRHTGLGQLSWYDSNSVNTRSNIVSGFKYAINFAGNFLGMYYNCFWNNQFQLYGSSNEPTYVEGNIWKNPMFEDTASFRLQAFSPCIDAGDPTILDVDSTRSDIGVYGGPGGMSYEYIDLAPATPETLLAIVDEDSIIISWNYNTETDFSHYWLHRDTIAGFEPSVFNMIADPETSLYVERDFDFEHDYYYRITAIDMQDNISDYSEELAVVLTDIDDLWDHNLPRVNKISSNYPNPFNAKTKINFYLADVGYQPAMVQMYIYDVTGRLVRKLIDERRYPGEHSVVWDGRNDSGGEVSSGVYFVRLIVSDLELIKPRKIMLVR